MSPAGRLPSGKNRSDPAEMRWAKTYMAPLRGWSLKASAPVGKSAARPLENHDLRRRPALRWHCNLVC